MPMASILCIPTQLGGLKKKLCHSPITPRQVLDTPIGNTSHFSSWLFFYHSSHLGHLRSSSLSADAREFACGSRRRQLGLCRKVHFRGLLSKCKATEFDSMPQETGEEDVAMGTLIWRAIKLPIYSVALVPLMVGIHYIVRQLAVWSFYFILLRNVEFHFISVIRNLIAVEVVFCALLWRTVKPLLNYHFLCPYGLWLFQISFHGFESSHLVPWFG